ncbi:MAG: rhamnogalacturonan acetylesterase [Bacteroidetes bacterium]|nr:rhamnogalacturonan acetylesterase [Bacteroidota bacterium]
MKPIICLFITLLPLLCAAQSHKYSFTPITPKGFTAVSPGSIYNEATGYGYESARQPGQPFYFSVRIPGGNYDVKLLLGNAKQAGSTTVRAECRRFMVPETATAKGAFKTVSFTVHVRDSLLAGGGHVRLKPREHDYYHWDNKLTLEFNGSSPQIASIEIQPNTRATTVFLAGNSTVVDQSEEPWAAWGQMIPSFFQPGKVAIANYAESGEALSSFIAAHRLQKIMEQIKPGDYLFIEFAHNDQKQKGEGIGPWTSYTRDLKKVIADVRAKGATPVLVTSMNRRNFDSTGHVYSTLGDYPPAMRKVAEEEKVALIDLNAKSKILYEAWGPQESVKAFVHYPANTFPGQDKELKDDTHFNTYGAYEIARCIAAGIRENKLPLAAALRSDLPAFDPAHPDPVAKWHWPLSPLKPTVKPDGN